jgi:hypothetical protein
MFAIVSHPVNCKTTANNCSKKMKHYAARKYQAIVITLVFASRTFSAHKFLNHTFFTLVLMPGDGPKPNQNQTQTQTQTDAG